MSNCLYFSYGFVDTDDILVVLTKFGFTCFSVQEQQNSYFIKDKRPAGRQSSAVIWSVKYSNNTVHHNTVQSVLDIRQM